MLENKDSGKEDIDIIRQNSDKIIDMVQDKIFETVKAANEIDIMYIEDMELGVTCFTWLLWLIYGEENVIVLWSAKYWRNHYDCEC